MRSIIVALVLWGSTALADPVIIENVRAVATGDTWRFDVTVRHPDTGWDHYADGWEVLGPDGESLGYRTLHHPHVNEQPFTRSLSGVAIPAGVTQVTIRAHCSVDGWDNAIPVSVPLDR